MSDIDRDSVRSSKKLNDRNILVLEIHYVSGIICGRLEVVQYRSVKLRM